MRYDIYIYIYIYVIRWLKVNPLNAELNPICHLLELLGGATIVVVSRLRVNGLYYPRIYLNVLRGTIRRLIHNIRYPNPRFQPGSYRRTQQECLYTQWHLASRTCNEEDDFLLSCVCLLCISFYYSGYVML